MNYQKIYDELMISRKTMTRIKTGNGLLECHHIIPKSFGGSEDKDNLVLLTPKEHFLAHKLLVKISFGRDKSKMCLALLMMCRNNQNQKRIKNSREYARVKILVSESCRGENHPQHGRKLSPERRAQISARMMGSNNHQWGKATWNKGLTKSSSEILKRSAQRYKEVLALRPELLLNRSHTQETREKISEKHRGRPKSETHKENLSISLKGRGPTREAIMRSADQNRGKKQELLECPYCNKQGGYAAMKRWHFENCPENQDGQTSNCTED